jgi:hypothetical protein
MPVIEPSGETSVRLLPRLCVAGLLCVVILATGCGGSSSSTAKLQTTTTSLPNGTVAAAYSANLAAVGGTPPYTWSQSSGGALPGGLSLGSAGVFAGTPTVAGTFGPYVFVVTDSASATASTQSLSITISANALSVTTSSLPQGTVNSAYSVTLAASGGTPPYTWSETSGGALPPGIAAVTSGGVLAGTPTTPGTYGPYVFTVTDSTNATAASGSLSFVVGNPNCASAGNESALPAGTPYAFLLRGTDSNGNPVDIAGSFTANGAGGITNAAMDYNGFTSGPQQMQINLAASSYSFSPTLQGCLSLVFSGSVSGNSAHTGHGVAPAMLAASSARVHERTARAAAASSLASAQFSFSLAAFDGTIFHAGRIIEFDSSGTNASGSMDLQIPAAFSLAGLPVNFAFGLNGWTAVSGGSLLRTAMAGAGTNTAGALSAGYTDVNVGGTASGELTGGSGTLNASIDPNTGRGTGTYTIPMTSGNLSFDFAFYVLDGSFYLLSTDTPSAGGVPLLAGRTVGANATNAPGALNGFYLLEAQGLETSGGAVGNYAAIGTLNTANTGAISIANFYVNDAGVYTSTPYLNAGYAVKAASGRVTFTGLNATPPVVYLTNGTTNSQIAGFLVGSDSQVSSGVIVASTNAPSLALTSVAGRYAASNEEDADAKNGASLGLFNFTGTGLFTATQIYTGAPAKIPGTGTIAVSGDGSGNLNSGNYALVTNGDVVFLIATQGDPLLYIVDASTTPN